MRSHYLSWFACRARLSRSHSKISEHLFQKEVIEVRNLATLAIKYSFLDFEIPNCNLHIASFPHNKN